MRRPEVLLKAPHRVSLGIISPRSKDISSGDLYLFNTVFLSNVSNFIKTEIEVSEYAWYVCVIKRHGVMNSSFQEWKSFSKQRKKFIHSGFESVNNSSRNTSVKWLLYFWLFFSELLTKRKFSMVSKFCHKQMTCWTPVSKIKVKMPKSSYSCLWKRTTTYYYGDKLLRVSCLE